MVLLLFTGISLFGQQPTPAQSFVIKEQGTVSDVKPYEDALNKANLDKYRYFDHRSELKFENGMVVELLSAHEMMLLGLPVKTDRVRTEKPKYDSGSLFRLAENGILVEVMTKTLHK